MAKINMTNIPLIYFYDEYKDLECSYEYYNNLSCKSINNNNNQCIQLYGDTDHWDDNLFHDLSGRSSGPEW